MRLGKRQMSSKYSNATALPKEQGLFVLTRPNTGSLVSRGKGPRRKGGGPLFNAPGLGVDAGE